MAVSEVGFAGRVLRLDQNRGRFIGLGWGHRKEKVELMLSSVMAIGNERYLNANPQNLELVEFIKIFRERYFIEGGDGFKVVVMTNDELLLLSKYLYSGIMDSRVAAISGTRAPSDLVKTLERFARRNTLETGLDVIATEEELRALGVFLVCGLAEVFLVLEGMDERTICC